MAASDLKLGPCQVLYGTNDAEVDFGKTEGGVIYRRQLITQELFTDQDGESPVDEVITGETNVVEVPMAEITLGNLATAFGFTLLALDDKHGFWGTSLVGTRLRASAQSLLLKRYVSGSVSTDTEDWIRFPKAAVTGGVELGFDKSNQQVIGVIFKIFKDDSNQLYVFGDETAATSGS